MNVHEHQLRSLTVCRCWVHGHRENLAASPGRRSLLQGAQPSSTSTRSESHAFQANREEHLIILTCDHVALMRPSETEASDQLVLGSDSSWSVASSSTNEQHQQALVLSISLSQITSIEIENGGIVLQYVPNMAGPSKPCGATTYEAQNRAGSPQFPVLGALVERARSVFSKDEISKRNQLRSASASSPRPSSGDGDDPAAVVRTLVLDTETQEVCAIPSSKTLKRLLRPGINVSLWCGALVCAGCRRACDGNSSCSSTFGRCAVVAG
jgi:hypothetical protein